MMSAAGDVVIVFNGEIYNFDELRNQIKECGTVFRSRSDTEVVLEAYRQWGVECLGRLNGMFSFAIYDVRRKTIFLARDRAGEKPLFYRYDGGALRFASELKVLMADSTLEKRISPVALDCYLALGYIPGDICVLEGFKKLPAAHAMKYDLRTGLLKVWRYWQMPECDRQENVGENALLDELEFLLEDAVRKQLVADVPVGVLLSGGVDSSLIAAMAVRASRDVKTFTIRFPGHGSTDETEHARLIAHHFGTEHIELDAQPTSVEMLPILARQFDEPMVDSSMIPTFLVSQLVRQHCAVALGGDGGDELFGGYGRYSRLLWMKRYLGHIPLSLRRGIGRATDRFLPVGMKGRKWLLALGADFENELPIIEGLFGVSSRKSLLSGREGAWSFVAENVFRQRVPSSADLLQRATRMEFQDYLCEDILVKVDRASMLSSLEVRAPMLDYRIIEFAFGKVPARLKATPQGKKILLKKLTERLLPPEFDRRRKQGFCIPLGEWLQAGPFRDVFYDMLLRPGCMFDSRVVRELLVGLDKGRSNGERLFALVMFELWRREYGAVL